MGFINMRHLRKCVSLDNKYVWFTEYTDKEIQWMCSAWFCIGATIGIIFTAVGFLLEKWLT